MWNQNFFSLSRGKILQCSPLRRRHHGRVQQRQLHGRRGVGEGHGIKYITEDTLNFYGYGGRGTPDCLLVDDLYMVDGIQVLLRLGT